VRAPVRPLLASPLLFLPSTALVAHASKHTCTRTYCGGLCLRPKSCCSRVSRHVAVLLFFPPASLFSSPAKSDYLVSSTSSSFFPLFSNRQPHHWLDPWLGPLSTRRTNSKLFVLTLELITGHRPSSMQEDKTALAAPTGRSP